jgi:putative endonuclease
MNPNIFSQKLGRQSEQVAVELLRANGYVIHHTNLRFPVGEIDILASEQDTLCFVEVRSVSSDEWGGPLATVTLPKQRRLIRVASWYLQRLTSLPRYTRFDVVGVTWPAAGGEPSIELIRGAFEVQPR